MTNDTNEALAALVRRLRDPWNHSEDLCEEAADMLTALAEKLAEAEALALEMELRHQRALTRLHEVEADADRLAEVLTFYRDTWRVVKNKRGLLEWRPQEGLLDDCGNQANDALAARRQALQEAADWLTSEAASQGGTKTPRGRTAQYYARKMRDLARIEAEQ